MQRSSSRGEDENLKTETRNELRFGNNCFPIDSIQELPAASVCVVRKHENRYSQWNLVMAFPAAWSRLCYLRA